MSSQSDWYALPGTPTYLYEFGGGSFRCGCCGKLILPTEQVWATSSIHENGIHKSGSTTHYCCSNYNGGQWLCRGSLPFSTGPEIAFRPVENYMQRLGVDLMLLLHLYDNNLFNAMVVAPKKYVPAEPYLRMRSPQTFKRDAERLMVEWTASKLAAL